MFISCERNMNNIMMWQNGVALGPIQNWFILNLRKQSIIIVVILSFNFPPFSSPPPLASTTPTLPFSTPIPLLLHLRQPWTFQTKMEEVTLLLPPLSFLLSPSFALICILGLVAPNPSCTNQSKRNLKLYPAHLATFSNCDLPEQ